MDDVLVHSFEVDGLSLRLFVGVSRDRPVQIMLAGYSRPSAALLACIGSLHQIMQLTDVTPAQWIAHARRNYLLPLANNDCERRILEEIFSFVARTF